MKKKLLTLWLLVIFAIICVVPVWAFTATGTVISYSADGSHVYQHYIPAVNFSLMMPLDGKAALISDEEDIKAIQVYFPQLPDTFYIFFLIAYPNAKDVVYSALEEDEVFDFINSISSLPRKTTYAIDQGLLEDQEVLRVFENRDGNTTQHLVTTHKNWIMNMMVQRLDYQGEFTKEEVALQEKLLKDTVNFIGLTQRHNIHMLPEFGRSLVLPKDYYFVVFDETADVKSYSIKSNTLEDEWYTLYMAYDENFIDQNVTTLSKGALSTLLMPTLVEVNQPEGIKKAPGLSDKIPVITYQSGSSSLPTTHFAALKEGWGILLSQTIPPGSYDSIDQKAGALLMENIMKQLLGEKNDPSALLKEGESPLMIDDVVYLPLWDEGLAIAFALPKGYGVQFDLENTYTPTAYIYDQESQETYFFLNVSYDGFFGFGHEVGKDLPEAEEWLEALITTLPDYNSPLFKRQVESYLNTYAIHSTWENQQEEEYLLFKNDYAILILLRSTRPLTQAESDYLRKNIDFIPFS